MLCLLLGAIVATVVWPWLGAWAGLVGLAAAGIAFAALKLWPKG